MKKILIFSNGEKIGDGLLKLPFIHEIRRRFFNSKIYWMTNVGSTVYNSRLKNIASQYIDTIYESANLSPFFWNKISNKYNFENLSFMSFCRASDATDEMFYWMKKANWRRLNIGIESFSQKVLREMGKRCTPKENHDALKLAKKHGIQTFMNFIMTTPETTLDDIQETVKGAKFYAEDSFYNAGITLAVKPLKGTDYFEEYR